MRHNRRGFEVRDRIGVFVIAVSIALAVAPGARAAEPGPITAGVETPPLDEYDDAPARNRCSSGGAGRCRRNVTPDPKKGSALYCAGPSVWTST